MEETSTSTPSPGPADRSASTPVTARDALRQGWRWEAVVRCFVTHKHYPCHGCTPPCGTCAHCHRRLG